MNDDSYLLCQLHSTITIFSISKFDCKYFFNWDFLHARLKSHYKPWIYKKRKYKKIKAYRKSVLKNLHMKGQKKAFYRQRIPEFSGARKETVGIDILVTSRNGDRNIIQSIRITSRPPSRIRKWNQLSQFI